MTNNLLVSEREGIVTLTLNRPEKRNALDGKLIHALLQALQDAANKDTTRLLLIQGNGEHFCAGADIEWMLKISKAEKQDNINDACELASLVYELYNFPRPTIAIAHGMTLGGGLGLLSACDIALAAQTARFGFSEVKIGLIPSIISPYVVSAIGERQALYYFLTAKQFDSQEAASLGLIHQLVGNETYQAEGLAFAHSLLEFGPNALLAAKKLIRYIAKEKITEPLTQELAVQLAHLRTTPEAQEGLTAFLEKRRSKI
jgi:methylglutaconyl-CoA hydratase